MGDKFEANPVSLAPEKHSEARDAIGCAADWIEANCQPSRETSLALTKLEEAMFWANASLARNGATHGRQ